jgi:hypothetical protein
MYSKLKMNARTAICKSQLRQISVLFTAYAATYNGHLPNDSTYSYSDPAYMGGTRHIGDIPKPTVGNASLYSYWNGHLLPFLDTPIKNLDAGTKITIDGKVRWVDSITGQSGIDTRPANPLAGGWAIITDASTKGGFGDLKTFICPEIFNTFDVRVMLKNGIKQPRMHLNTYSGAEYYGFGYMNVPIPTTYMANSSFFGYNQVYREDVDSKRLDQISEISKKVLLIEGGLANPSWGEDNGCPYFFAGNQSNIIGRSLAISAYQIGFRKSETYAHRYSFVHDDKEEFWSTLGDTTASSSPYYYFDGNHCSDSTANEFNQRFSGKAYLLPYSAVSEHRGYHVVSFVAPINENGTLNDFGIQFDNFLKARGVGTRYTKYEHYESDYQYLTGNMDVLFGDGSVGTKDHAWLLNNRLRISSDSVKE